MYRPASLIYCLRGCWNNLGVNIAIIGHIFQYLPSMLPDLAGTFCRLSLSLLPCVPPCFAPSTLLFSLFATPTPHLRAFEFQIFSQVGYLNPSRLFVEIECYVEKTAEANGGLTKKDYLGINSPISHNLVESYHLNIGAY